MCVPCAYMCSSVCHIMRAQRVNCRLCVCMYVCVCVSIQVLELVSEGKVTPYIDRVFPLEEMVSAHEYMDAGKHKGKVVIQVKQETAKK